jgi:hypothetical protein
MPAAPLIFDTTPAVGTILTWDGRDFTVLKVEPYTRKSDGAATHTITYQGHCRVCGAAFESIRGMAMSFAHNCAAHKGMRAPKPAQPVKPRVRLTRGSDVDMSKVSARAAARAAEIAKAEAEGRRVTKFRRIPGGRFVAYKKTLKAPRPKKLHRLFATHRRGDFSIYSRDYSRGSHRWEYQVYATSSAEAKRLAKAERFAPDAKSVGVRKIETD